MKKILSIFTSLLIAVSTLFADSFNLESATISKASPRLSQGAISQVKDFILKAKIKTTNGAKGAIYFHTDSDLKKGYAVAIDNDTNSKEWWRTTGSLLSVRNLTKRFVNDDEWFDIELKVHGAEIDIWVNGLQVVEYIEPAKPFRTQKNAKMLLSDGMIDFLHTGGGNIEIKDLSIQKLQPRKDVSNQQFNAIDEQETFPIRLHQQDFPVLDFHVHLKGGFTQDWAFAKSRKLGINYAVAPNLGKDFELNQAPKASDFIKYTGSKYPFTLCMQAEGREWYKLFPKEIRNQFTYVFTDAMTFDDLNGKRTHIWRENEVDCPKGSEEAYMDLIVDTICFVLENEPADIYANPMRLPKVLDKDFNKYWTNQRRQRVLDSLVKGSKALEINMISKLPDAQFIKDAKKRNVKFTFGSNNASADFGKFEFAYKMIKECSIDAYDIFNPQDAKISKQ